MVLTSSSASIRSLSNSLCQDFFAMSATSSTSLEQISLSRLAFACSTLISESPILAMRGFCDGPKQRTHCTSSSSLPVHSCPAYGLEKVIWKYPLKFGLGLVWLASNRSEFHPEMLMPSSEKSTWPGWGEWSEQAPTGIRETSMIRCSATENSNTAECARPEYLVRIPPASTMER